MQADSATAGPTGLLKGCTMIGDVFELHDDELLLFWLPLKPDPGPCLLPRPLPVPRPRPRPLPRPRPVPRPLPLPRLARSRRLRFGGGATSGVPSSLLVQLNDVYPLCLLVCKCMCLLTLEFAYGCRSQD